MTANNPDPAQDVPAAPGGTPGQPVRSESLLPAGDEQDERYAVAEEVSLDQQSDTARRVGSLPPDPAPGASLPDALQGSVGSGDTAPPPPESLENKLPPPI